MYLHECIPNYEKKCMPNLYDDPVLEPEEAETGDEAAGDAFHGIGKIIVPILIGIIVLMVMGAAIFFLVDTVKSGRSLNDVNSKRELLVLQNSQVMN